MNCNYNSKLAGRLGVNSALAADYLYSAMKTESVRKEKRDWVKCSGVKLSAVYPHMKRSAASRALKRLVENGVLVRQAFNKRIFDSTFFYSFTEYGKTLTEPERQDSPDEATAQTLK